MRSQVGRLTRENKSGSGRKELTERDKWIKEKFGFLARIQSRAGVNVNIFFFNVLVFHLFSFQKDI
jgi:hypothetical protein